MFAKYTACCQTGTETAQQQILVKNVVLQSWLGQMQASLKVGSKTCFFVMLQAVTLTDSLQSYKVVTRNINVSQHNFSSICHPQPLANVAVSFKIDTIAQKFRC